ncbi:MAG: hypothetical protein FWE88_05515 [Phycisphaerae bacterium]|nr:hypothetical protein [Phycisphaerae bacterium]
MGLRNTTKPSQNHSREALQPCRQPVDTGAAKKALSAFVTACRTTAAATTIALTVGLSSGCMGTPPQSTMGAPPANQIDTPPTEKSKELRGEPASLRGYAAPAHIMMDDE